MLLQIHCIQLDTSLLILHTLCSISAVSAAMNSGQRLFAESGIIILQEQTHLELPVGKVP